MEILGGVEKIKGIRGLVNLSYCSHMSGGILETPQASGSLNMSRRVAHVYLSSTAEVVSFRQ